jgi:hypothetical protein
MAEGGCLICGATFGPHSPPTYCDICQHPVICLTCLMADDSGIAACPPCRRAQESLCSETEAKRIKLDLRSCGVCDAAFGRTLLPCGTCGKYYCEGCMETRAHPCVGCAVPGCAALSMRKHQLIDGRFELPLLHCCAAGPICTYHRLAHRLSWTCINANNVFCGRCGSRINRWSVCRWPQCGGVHACGECGGYCSAHLKPEIERCGLCASRYFPRPIENTGVVWSRGACCGHCFERVRTFIECVLLRLHRHAPRGYPSVPKDVIRLLLRLL